MKRFFVTNAAPNELVFARGLAFQRVIVGKKILADVGR
jgi:hypothetical protein